MTSSIPVNTRGQSDRNGYALTGHGEDPRGGTVALGATLIHPACIFDDLVRDITGKLLILIAQVACLNNQHEVRGLGYH